MYGIGLTCVFLDGSSAEKRKSSLFCKTSSIFILKSSIKRCWPTQLPFKRCDGRATGSLDWQVTEWILLNFGILIHCFPWRKAICAWSSTIGRRWWIFSRGIGACHGRTSTRYKIPLVQNTWSIGTKGTSWTNFLVHVARSFALIRGRISMKNNRRLKGWVSKRITGIWRFFNRS